VREGGLGSKPLFVCDFIGVAAVVEYRFTSSSKLQHLFEHLDHGFIQLNTNAQ